MDTTTRTQSSAEPSPNLRPYGPLIAFWNSKSSEPRRTLEALDLLVDGRSYEECAEEMHISKATVKRHIETMTTELSTNIRELKTMRMEDYRAHIADLHLTTESLSIEVAALKSSVEKLQAQKQTLQEIVALPHRGAA